MDEDEIADIVSEYLSDVTGFLHEGFDLNIEVNKASDEPDITDDYDY